MFGRKKKKKKKEKEKENAKAKAKEQNPSDPKKATPVAKNAPVSGASKQELEKKGGDDTKAQKNAPAKNATPPATSE